MKKLQTLNLSQNYQKTRENTFEIVLGVLVVCWVLFFVIPVFGGETMVFPRYVYNMGTLGADLQQVVSYSNQVLSGKSPYIGRNVYPPFASVVFLPFTQIDHKAGYWIVLAMTLGSFGGLWWMSGMSSVASLLFLACLVGYGMQFEIERGQWNVIVFFLSMLGLRLWKKNKFLGGSLLTLAIQLKLWPAFFLFGIDEIQKD